MKLEVIPRVSSEQEELVYFPEDGEEQIPKTVAMLKDAIETELRALREEIRSDLIDLWKRIDRIENK